MQFLQQYWWCIVSLLGALLVMLLFVQGGQTFIFQFSRKNSTNRSLIVNTFGRKWEFTFTTLVTFGGAFFAAFPKFYSISFGGATYVWIAILLTMIIQAVSYEFRSKDNNVLGTNTYDVFLTINGFLAPLLLGIAVGTFFFGADFKFTPIHFTSAQERFAITSWNSDWHGLEAIADYRNLLLGFAVLFLAKISGLLYMINSVNDENLVKKCRKTLPIDAVSFLIFFISFMVCLLTANGVNEMYVTSVDENQLGSPFMVERECAYLNNFLALPWISGSFILGVLLVLIGIIKGAFTKSTSGIWFSSLGTFLVVFSLFIVAAWNGASYYHSLTSINSSLTISNSSSSYVTLQVMMYASFIIPFVVAYIWWAWRSMNKKKLDAQEIDNSSDLY